jgi:hypothetical protein
VRLLVLVRGKKLEQVQGGEGKSFDDKWNQRTRSVFLSCLNGKTSNNNAGGKSGGGHTGGQHRGSKSRGFEAAVEYLPYMLEKVFKQDRDLGMVYLKEFSNLLSTILMNSCHPRNKVEQNTTVDVCVTSTAKTFDLYRKEEQQWTQSDHHNSGSGSSGPTCFELFHGIFHFLILHHSHLTKENTAECVVRCVSNILRHTRYGTRTGSGEVGNGTGTDRSNVLFPLLLFL